MMTDEWTHCKTNVGSTCDAHGNIYNQESSFIAALSDWILFTPLSNELTQNSAPVFNTRNVINILDRAILFYLLANSGFKRLFCMNKKSLYDEEHFLQLHKIVVNGMSVCSFTLIPR